MRAKKSLGQHFLKSKEALRLIIGAGNIEPSDLILEGGPGKGMLTKELLMKARKVIAVEKDEELVAFLKDTFSNEVKTGKLEILSGDILEIKLSDTFGTEKYKVIANIPYYITGALLRKFLEEELQPEKMVLLVQKEVAERIVAKDGKESILSISVKAYGTPRYIKTVKAKYFSPEPNVDSAIIAIETISKNFFNDLDENFFFSIVKTGFAHKRKMLRGNLGTSYKNIPEVLNEIGLTATVRAEDLNIDQWKKIVLLLKKQKEDQ